MIELPEALTIANQITGEFQGKCIASASRGNTPHRFAFYSRTAEEYAAILPGKTMGQATVNGSLILISIEPDYVLMLGEGGERILYHANAATLPKKHHLILQFQDGAYLTVTVQGWGSAQLLTVAELAVHPFYDIRSPSPLSDEFTLGYFQSLFRALDADDKRSIKYFIISKPGILGIGNGYLQDILYRAKIHPRRRAVEVGAEEQHALYDAIRTILQHASCEGGRDTEYDLYGHPGRYIRLLDGRMVGKPCIDCGTPLAKEQFLGGTVYFCPRCQS